MDGLEPKPVVRLCLNCKHPEDTHDVAGCSYVLEGSCADCDCTEFVEWPDQPLDAAFPQGAVLEELEELAKRLTEDGRMIPAELAEEIAGKRARSRNTNLRDLLETLIPEDK